MLSVVKAHVARQERSCVIVANAKPCLKVDKRHLKNSAVQEGIGKLVCGSMMTVYGVNSVGTPWSPSYSRGRAGWACALWARKKSRKATASAHEDWFILANNPFVLACPLLIAATASKRFPRSQLRYLVAPTQVLV